MYVKFLDEISLHKNVEALAELRTSVILWISEFIEVIFFNFSKSGKISP